MCFYIKKDEILIAKKDIICYKLLFNSNNKLKALVMNYKYKLNKLEIINNWEDKIKLDRHVTYSYYKTSIERGFHSYKKNLRKHRRLWNWDVVVKCIIPKGSLYMENDTEYVSNKIIPKKILTSYTRKRCKS